MCFLFYLQVSVLSLRGNLDFKKVKPSLAIIMAGEGFLF